MQARARKRSTVEERAVTAEGDSGARRESRRETAVRLQTQRIKRNEAIHVVIGDERTTKRGASRRRTTCLMTQGSPDYSKVFLRGGFPDRPVHALSDVVDECSPLKLCRFLQAFLHRCMQVNPDFDGFVELCTDYKNTFRVEQEYQYEITRVVDRKRLLAQLLYRFFDLALHSPIPQCVEICAPIDVVFLGTPLENSLHLLVYMAQPCVRTESMLVPTSASPQSGSATSAASATKPTKDSKEPAVAAVLAPEPPVSEPVAPAPLVPAPSQPSRSTRRRTTATLPVIAETVGRT